MPVDVLKISKNKWNNTHTLLEGSSSVETHNQIFCIYTLSVSGVINCKIWSVLSQQNCDLLLANAQMNSPQVGIFADVDDT